MTQFHYTQDYVAKRIGKSRSYVANILRLNNLPGNIKGLILEGKMTAGHARALLGMENAEQLVEQIIEQNLNVREVEKKVRQVKKPLTQRTSNIIDDKSEDVLSLEAQLKNILRQKFRSL